MKTNEARAFFRVLALLIAIPAWCVAGVIVYLSLVGPHKELVEWRVLGTSILGGAAFSYVALRGYMPRFLLHLFTRGRVADGKGYKQ